MERLRYVARAGPADPAVVVAETVEAIASLRPEPAELVNLCRQLVQRNPTCAPLWWLGAHLLHDGVERLWRLAEEISDDPTPRRLAEALPEGATVLTVGAPALAGRAFARRGDVRVLAVDAGGATSRFVRKLERSDVDVTAVEAAAAVAAARAADLAVVEVDALSGPLAIGPIGAALLTVVARAGGVPVWVLAGRGRVLPGEFVAATLDYGLDVDAPWECPLERVDLPLEPERDRLVTADGIVPWPVAGTHPECPFTPELLPRPPSSAPQTPPNHL
jgi:hypothetical protein